MNYNIFHNVYYFLPQSKKIDYLLAVFDGDNFKYAYENWFHEERWTFHEVSPKWTNISIYKSDYIVLQTGYTSRLYDFYDKIRDEIKIYYCIDLLFIKDKSEEDECWGDFVSDIDSLLLRNTESELQLVRQFRFSEDKKEIVDKLVELFEDDEKPLDGIMVFEKDCDMDRLHLTNIIYDITKIMPDGFCWWHAADLCEIYQTKFMFNNAEKIITVLEFETDSH